MTRTAKRTFRRVTPLILGIAIGIILTALIMSAGGTAATDTPEFTVPDTNLVIAAQGKDEAPADYEITHLVYKTEAQPTFFKPNEADVELLAKTIWGEARGVKSITEKAAVAWCILNRVDAKGYACGGDIEYVLTFPGQFVGYDEDNPVTTECKEIAADVLARWAAEKAGHEDVGRVLPKEYTYFTGDGKRNYFTDEWKGGNTWDWSLPSPYEK